MESSRSFHESMEHQISSHQNMLRNTSPVAQSDVTKFFQCLRFDPKMVASDQTLSIRQGDFEKLVCSALGIQGDESPSKPGEIKKLKAILRETNVKASECLKMFDEASSVFNKCFPSVPTKKMSQLEELSGGCSGKMGIQSQTLAGDFELDLQNLNEQQSGVRHKGTRSPRIGVPSMAKQSVSGYRVRKTPFRMRNTVQDEDQTSIGIDGCEKSKMKNKRFCINGFRDLEQGTQDKSVGDSEMLRSSIRSDSNSSDFLNTKTNVPVSGLKSGPGRPRKLFSGVQNTPLSNLRISGCTSEPPAVTGVTDGKPTRSNHSSLPPATQCGVQRPQKIARGARRTKLPIVSDEVPNSDDVNPGSIETGFRLHKNSPAASPQLKLKGENNFCPRTLSEREESGSPEIKSNETEKQFDEKATESRKNHKPVTSEKIDNGVRSQGRSLNPMGAEKNKNEKQHCGARHSFDRSESKLGRTPAMKPLIIRTHNRQKAMATDSSNLELQGSDIGREDQLAAVILQEEHSSMSPTPVQLSHEELATNREDSKAFSLHQMIESAIIPEDSISINEDLQVDGLGDMNDFDSSEFNALMKNLGDSNGCRNNERVELDESEEDGSAIPFEGFISSAHETNGRLSDIEYEKLGLNEKILLELQYLGIFYPLPSLVNVEDDEVVEEINKLEDGICKESPKKKEMVNKLLNSAIEQKELQEKELYQHGHDKLIEMTRTEDTVMDNDCNPSATIPISSQRSPDTRVTENCTASPDLQTSDSALPEQTTGKDDTTQSTRTKKKELLVDVGIGTPLSSGIKRKRSETSAASPDLQPSESALPEPTTGKDETTRSSMGKKKESLLNDVGIRTLLSSSIKRQRIENRAASTDWQPSESPLLKETTGKEYTTRSSKAKKKELLLDDDVIRTQLSSRMKQKRSEPYAAASPSSQPSESPLPEQTTRKDNTRQTTRKDNTRQTTRKDNTRQTTRKDNTRRSTRAKTKESLQLDDVIRTPLTPLSSRMKQKRSEPCAAASPSLQPSESPLLEQTTGKDNTRRSTRAKTKESLQLDDVGTETSLPSSTTRKRSGRGRGRGLVRGRSNTNNRSSLPKGRRKPRPNKTQTTSKVSLPEPVEANQCTNNLEEPEELEPPFDLSKLEIPEGIEFLKDIYMPMDLSSWLPPEDNTDEDNTNDNEDGL